MRSTIPGDEFCRQEVKKVRNSEGLRV